MGNNSKKIEEELKKDIQKYSFENIQWQRQFIQSICIISGSLASFSLFVLNSNAVQTKDFLILAIFLLLFVIGVGLFRLKTIIEKEDNELTKIEKMVHEKSILFLSKFLEHENSGSKLDYTLDLLTYSALGSLIAIVFAFLPSILFLWFFVSVALILILFFSFLSIIIKLLKK